MKTTVEIPDNLYRLVKSRAALEGLTVKAYLIDALRDKLQPPEAEPATKETGWRAVFGKGDQEAVADVQRIIDEDHNRIDYDSWGLPDPEANR